MKKSTAKSTKGRTGETSKSRKSLAGATSKKGSGNPIEEPTKDE